MGTSTPTSAIWTPGHDQFGRPCWKHKETLQLCHDPSEQFAAQPQRSFGYGPNPNIPAGPRFTPVAASSMEVFPLWRANPHAPSGINQGSDGMANFSSAVNVWTPGYDQFGRPCWQNRETLQLHYDPSGQSPKCPPMASGDPSKASSTNKKDAASLSASPKPKTPSPLRTGRAKEAEQWSLKHNKQGVQLYVNSTTKKSQSQTPDCLKKYTTR